MPKLYLILHNIRSAHNVGAMLRTAEGLAVDKVYLCGYTPYPAVKTDQRLPHEANAVDQRIHKTALGAERLVAWQKANIEDAVAELKASSAKVAALEQTDSSFDITSFKNSSDIALIVGEEVRGLPQDILELCDLALQIPMLGQKESFNVASAAAIALYHLRFQA